MVRAKERQEARRIYVVVDDRGILAVHHVVHANARRPAVAAKCKFPLHRQIERCKIWEPELSRLGNDLAKLVDGHKGKAGTPDAGPCQVKFLQLPWHRIAA